MQNQNAPINWLTPINLALTKALAHAGLADNELETLHDCHCRVLIRGLPEMILTIKQRQIYLQTPAQAKLPEENIDLTIETDIETLRQMVDTGYAPPGKLKMSGDIAIAQQMQTLFKQLDIDWVGLWGSYIGEAPAQIIHDAGQKAWTYGKQVGQDKAASLTEYLLHERKLLVSTYDWQALREETQTLLDRIERAHARAQKLRRQLDES